MNNQRSVRLLNYWPFTGQSVGRPNAFFISSKQMDKNTIKNILERPIAFYPVLARFLGSIEAAVYLQQLIYWADKGRRTDGYIYKTKDDIEQETTLSRKQQDRVRSLLVKKGIISIKKLKANGAPTLHYKVNFGIVQKGLMEKSQRDYSITENTTETTVFSKENTSASAFENNPFI